MDSDKSFSLMVFDRRDFLVYYDVTQAHLELWTKGAANGSDTAERLGSLFLPMLAANKSMRCSLDNGVTGISGKKFTLVTKRCLGCTLILCGQSSLLDLSHILYQSVKVNPDEGSFCPRAAFQSSFHFSSSMLSSGQIWVTPCP